MPAGTFVLVHSPLMGPTTWHLVADAMTAKGRQVIVPRLRPTDVIDEPYWSGFAEQVVEAVSPGLDRVVLVGHSAAGLLLRTLKGEIRPVLGYRRAPMIMPVQRTRTKRGSGPLADAHVAARAAEAAGEVLAASYFTVQPWMDLPELRYAAVTIADGDAEAADRQPARREDQVADELAARHLLLAGSREGEVVPPPRARYRRPDPRLRSMHCHRRP